MKLNFVIVVLFIVSTLLIAGDSMLNYDFKILIDNSDSNKKDFQSISNLNKLETKIIHLRIMSDSIIEFELNKQTGVSVKLLTDSTQNGFQNGSEYCEKNITLEVICLAKGKQNIQFANNLFDKDFTIFLDVSDVNIDEIQKEIGLEDFIKNEKSKSKIISTFGEPNYQSSIFKDELQIIEYFFPKYNIGYEILIKSGKVFDYKRLPE